MATATRASAKRAARVTIANGACNDHQLVSDFTPKVFLQAPRNIKVTLPPTRKGADDEVTVFVQEGDWEHTHLWFNAEAGGGLGLSGEFISIEGTAVRFDQIERLAKALQLAVDEAKRLGFTTPRSAPGTFREIISLARSALSNAEATPQRSRSA
jgi:hypothetical protein